MFLFCFEGELSYFKLPSQRPLYFFDHSLHSLRGEKLQFTQSNFMQCKLDQKNMMFSTGLGLVELLQTIIVMVRQQEQHTFALNFCETSDLIGWTVTCMTHYNA